ncbi:HAD family hydrolase [Bacillaceae bacterium SAS-127]|nr:HAD family hydrolase [Bacillaceae bacterium SAS-127]
MKFVFDIDGTVCFDGQRIERPIQTAIDECVKMKHEVIFASARPIRDLLPVLPKKYHSFQMIGGNGAFVMKNEQIEIESFDWKTIKQIKDLIEQYHLNYLVDSDWHYSYTGDEAHPIFERINTENGAQNKLLNDLTCIAKIILFTSNSDIEEQLQGLSIELHKHTNESLLDISPIGIHKYAGLEKLAVFEKQYVAFGNDQNDASLFQHALESVCVGEHEIKRLATTSIKKEDVANSIIKLAEKYV